MQQKKSSFRVRLGNFIAGNRKEFVQPLSPLDGWSLNGSGRLNQYGTKPEQIAANIGWCWAANTSIVDPAAAIKLKLYRKMKDGDREEVTDGPAMGLMDLLDNPNMAHTGEQQRQLHFTYMNFVGESYIYMMKGNEHFTPARGQLPDALHIIPAHRVVFKLGDSYTKSIVKFDKRVYPITSFIRDINPDPDLPYNGRSIIAAAAATIDIDSQMKAWDERFFANNARPSMVFKTNEPLDNDAYERWKSQFNDNYTGTSNAFKPLLIEGGDAKPYMLSHADLDFIKSREFTRDEILSMWRVSPGILGYVKDVNRANLEAGFYIHAVINIVPRVRQFVRQLNSTLVSVYDPTLELDYENPVPEDVQQKLKEAEAGVNKWLTIDETRDMYGMEPLPNGLGSHIIIPAKTPITLDDVVNGEAPDKESGQNPEDPDDDNDDDLTEAPNGRDQDKALAGVKKKTLTEQQRTDRGEAKTQLYRQRAEAYEASMLNVLRQQFDLQRTEIISRAYTTQLRKDMAGLSRKDAQQRKRDWMAALIAWSAYDDRMRKALAPVLYALLVETGKQAMQQAGMEPSQFDPTALDVLNYQQQRASKIADDVNDETEKQLRASVSQGIDQDENDDQLRARIESVMGAALTYRASRIARTETTRAQGFADVAAWKQSGIVTGKEWYVQSGNPCPFCRSMDGVIVKLDANFLTLGDVLTADGKTLNINYDNIASPPVHVNCQCTLLDVQVPLD